MRGFALLKLIRLHYTLPLTGGLVVIALYAAGSWGALPTCLPWACLSLFLMLAGTYSLNDLCDIKSDRINHPQRVLIQGQLSTRTALVSSVTFFALSLLCAMLCHAPFLLGMVLLGAGLVAYDLFSKSLGFFKAVLVALLATALYPLALSLTGFSTDTRTRTLWFHPLWFFLTSLAYEMLKDIRDIKGDRLAETNAPSHIQQRWYHRLYPKIIWISTIFLLPPYLLGYCHTIYLFAITGAIASALFATKASTKNAIHALYLAVVLVTLGSLLDLFLA